MADTSDRPVTILVGVAADDRPQGNTGQQVEEMALYIVQLNNAIEVLKSEVNELKERREDKR